MKHIPERDGFRSKLGAAKGEPRSRIWIEGKRLVAAGFTVGAAYIRTATPYGMQLSLVPPGYKPLVPHQGQASTQMLLHVSGKGEKPIIDITGVVVRETFAVGRRTHVDVVYRTGYIELRRTS